MHSDMGFLCAIFQISCVEQLCDQLCYRLELAYFAASANSGISQSATSRIFVRGNRIRGVENIEAPADPFVANLVLERLTMHSPIRVSFYFCYYYYCYYFLSFYIT